MSKTKQHKIKKNKIKTREQGMVVHVYSLSTWEVRTGGSGVQGHLIFSYIGTLRLLWATLRLYLKKTKN